MTVALGETDQFPYHDVQHDTTAGSSDGKWWGGLCGGRCPPYVYAYTRHERGDNNSEAEVSALMLAWDGAFSVNTEEEDA